MPIDPAQPEQHDESAEVAQNPPGTSEPSRDEIGQRLDELLGPAEALPTAVRGTDTFKLGYSLRVLPVRYGIAPQTALVPRRIKLSRFNS